MFVQFACNQLFLTPSIIFLSRFFVKPKKENLEDKDEKQLEEKFPITMERIAVSLFIAALIAAMGNIIAPPITKSTTNRS